MAFSIMPQVDAATRSTCAPTALAPATAPALAAARCDRLGRSSTPRAVPADQTRREPGSGCHRVAHRRIQSCGGALLSDAATGESRRQTVFRTRFAVAPAD